MAAAPGSRQSGPAAASPLFNGAWALEPDVEEKLSTNMADSPAVPGQPVFSWLLAPTTDLANRACIVV